MYLDLNNIFRAQINGFNPEYRSVPMIKFYNEDTPSDDEGAHLRALLNTNQPDATEIGFKANEEVTGFMQIGMFLPASDKGLNNSLSKLANDAHTYFSRKSFVDGDIKFEILNTEKSDNLRIDGHFTVTLRVNYRAFVCNN